MARGQKKHMKRIRAPKSWMVAKKGKGIHITRPSAGPHKLRECLPLDVLIRQKLHYAMNLRETKMILNDKEVGIRVDGKVRTDHGFPVGVMDVVSITKTGEKYRVLYDQKGRFVLKQIKEEEGKFKLLKVTRKATGVNKVPYIVTHDGRTIRFPNPEIDINDTLKFDFIKNKIVEFIKFETGNTVFITGGNNLGRIGHVQHLEKHPGSFNIAHVKDANGKSFATRMLNCFVIGKKKSYISLPAGEGLWYNALEEKQHKEAKH